MKEAYYQTLQKNKLADILFEVKIIPYSSKNRILKELLNDYSPEQINMALNEYKINYIDLNRVEIFKLKNILKYYCKNFEEKSEKN